MKRTMYLVVGEKGDCSDYTQWHVAYVPLVSHPDEYIEEYTRQ